MRNNLFMFKKMVFTEVILAYISEVDNGIKVVNVNLKKDISNSDLQKKIEEARVLYVVFEVYLVFKNSVN